MSLALSAFPRLRLWVDALDRVAWQARVRERVRDELQKYMVPTERFRVAPLRLGTIFTLTTHNRGTLEFGSAGPATALRELLRYTYRWKLVRGLRGQAPHFRNVGALARQVPLMCVRRPQHPFLPDESLTRSSSTCRTGGLRMPTTSVPSSMHPSRGNNRVDRGAHSVHRLARVLSEFGQ